MPILTNQASRFLGGSKRWYTAGGAPLPIAAYQPKGAASLAASYVNLANPGTYDAAPGTAPTFDPATGWTFAAASNQYLKTGLLPTAGWTLIVRYAVSGSGVFVMAGSRNTAAASTRLQVGGATTTVRNYGYAGFFVVGSGALSSGVQAVTSAGGYYNGELEVATANVWSGTGLEIWIGCLNQDGAVVQPLDGTIQDAAIYNSTLTAAQVAAVSAAMAAL